MILSSNSDRIVQYIGSKIYLDIWNYTFLVCQRNLNKFDIIKCPLACAAFNFFVKKQVSK